MNNQILQMSCETNNSDVLLRSIGGHANLRFHQTSIVLKVNDAK